MSDERNPQDIVRAGYDRIGNRYSEWGTSKSDDARAR